MFAEVCFKPEIGGNGGGRFLKSITWLIFAMMPAANQPFDNINRTDLKQVR